MEYGAMNHPIYPLLDQIPGFARMGFDYLELTLDAPCAHYSVVRQQSGQIRRTLEEHGMGLVCHLPTFVFTADLTPAIRAASVEEMTQSVTIAAELGAEKAVLHPGILTGLGHLAKNLCFKYGMESLQTIAQSAHTHGIKLCAENMPPFFGMFYEPEAFTSLFQTFPQFGLTLDTGHANIQLGENPRPERLSEFVQHFSRELCHLHVSDNQGSSDDHFPLGKGNIDFSSLVSRLKAVGYDKTVTLEIFSQDPKDLATSREHFARLMNQA